MEWYTKEEVAKILDLSPSTVYYYGRTKKIETIPDPHRVFPEIRYTKDSVDRLKETLQTKVTGVSPSALAESLQISRYRIYELIHSLALDVPKIPFGTEKFRYALQPEHVEAIRAIVEKEETRTPRFYDAARDVALYQMFTNGTENVRLLWNTTLHEWGVNRYGMTWVSLAELEKEGFQASYNIHQPSMRAQDSLLFHVPKQDGKNFFFLDLVYKEWGVENCTVEDRGTSIHVTVKEGQIPFEESWPTMLSVDEVKNWLQRGAFEWDGTTFYSQSDTVQMSMTLERNMRERIKMQARQEGLTMNEWLNRTIRTALQEKNTSS